MSATRPEGARTKARRYGGLLTDDDLYLLGEGTHYRTWEKLGAHEIEISGRRGTHFAVWAPNAERVSVVGDFNDWVEGQVPMRPAGESGVWTAFVEGVGEGALYKYAIRSRVNGYHVEKADPYAFSFEPPPRTASRVCDLSRHAWRDAAWMERRAAEDPLAGPMTVYEVHLGSWRRVLAEGDRPLSYRELAHALVEYCTSMGFTHVELLPITEHPFAGSWGYQTIGYYAPTARHGSPTDFMELVDTLHQAGVGVILDWVPAHFPKDEHGLGYFDGTHLYEHADPRQGEHQDWGTLIFNYGRNEVTNFLLANALFWLEVYHVDGLRVDAVASMLYLDYSRREGEWVPNRFGGRENLEAIEFLKRFNTLVYERHPGAVTIAEESTSWPMVSRPVYLGGLGFGFKWNMGWMHDTLGYFGHDPIHRKYHHNDLTFSMMYAFHENFVLPLSHDEVVHGKGSLLRKMPGDEWQRFANLRLMLGYMWTHPGKKLLFMGGEIGQAREWDHDASIDWHLLEEGPRSSGLQRFVRDLNTLLRGEPALYRKDHQPDGFRWIDCHDSEQSVLSWLRRADGEGETIVVVGNFTPIPRHSYRVGVPVPGRWDEVLNSDAEIYGGSGQGNLGGVESVPVAHGGFFDSLVVTLPPLGLVVFKEGRS